MHNPSYFVGIGTPGPWELGIVLLLALIIFGAGKLPQVFSQMGKGIKAFKDGMKEGEDATTLADLEGLESAEVSVAEAEEVSTKV